MVSVKDAPRTSTTIVVRSDAASRVTRSRDPYYSLMRRIFQEDVTATRGQKFLDLIEKRQHSGNPLKTSEWQLIMDELDVGRSSFYAMRNKLLGAGLVTNRKGEYHLSGQFSKDLIDMANWWLTAVLNQDSEED